MWPGKKFYPVKKRLHGNVKLRSLRVTACVAEIKVFRFTTSPLPVYKQIWPDYVLREAGKVFRDG